MKRGSAWFLFLFSLVFLPGAFSFLAAQSGRIRPTETPAPKPAIRPRLNQDPPTPATPTPTPDNTAGDDDVIRVVSNLVAIPASVIDPLGRPLKGLQLEDFELLVDGVAKPLSDVNFSEAPVRMVLLFDNSSSQTLARDLEKKAALKFFKRVLRSQDQAALIAVATEPRLVRTFTNDTKALVQAIENFGKPEGATALHDAVALAADYLKVIEGRRVIVIVSDGEDTISSTSFDLSLKLAQTANCQIYAVQTGHIENANLRQLRAERNLEEMTAQTGGAVYEPQEVADLDQAFNQIAADLSQQYILSYYPPTDEPRDGLFHTLTLRVKKQPDARIRARKGYYAPKRP